MPWIVSSITFELDDVCCAPISKVTLFSSCNEAKRFMQFDQLEWLYTEYAPTVGTDSVPHGGHTMWRLNADSEWRLRDIGDADEAISEFGNGERSLGTLEWNINRQKMTKFDRQAINETDWLEAESDDDDEESENV